MPVVSLARRGSAADGAMSRPLQVIAKVGTAFALSNVARGAIRLGTSLVVARGLGPSAFGRWIFCMAWAATLTSVLDLGFGVLLTRDAARDRRVGALLGSALAARLGLFVPVGAVFYLAAPRIVAVGTAQELRAALPLVAVGVAYGCLAAIFRGWTDRLLWILGMETAGVLVQGVLSWLLISRGRGVVDLLWLATFVQVLQFLGASALLARFRVPGDRIGRPTLAAISGTLGRSMPFALVGFIANAQQRVAPLLLGYLSTSQQVAAFGAAWRLGSTAWALPSAAFAGALPVLAERAGEHRSPDADAVKPAFHRALQTFVLVAAAVLALFAPVLLRLTYGADFVSAAPALMCVAVGLVPSLLNASRRVYLYAAGREAVALRWAIVAFVVQVGSCAVFVPRWGAVGAAAGLLLGECTVWWPLQRA